MHIGTCSCKFPAWTGLVYSGLQGTEMLTEYAGQYGCVEVDQWYWSLFGVDKVALPRVSDVESYASAVPEGFSFAVKLPDALTLTHLRPKGGGELVPNPHFLSPDLLRVGKDWSRIVTPRDAELAALVGPLMDMLAKRKNAWVFVNNHFEGKRMKGEG